MAWGSARRLPNKVFDAANFKTNSQTGGIQEAIDAAEKVGGGTVEMPAGTYVLHARRGQPALLIGSNVSLEGTGQDQTILELDPSSGGVPAGIANTHWLNPDAAAPDENIELHDFTLNLNGSKQVIGRGRLLAPIIQPGFQHILFEPSAHFNDFGLLLIDPGPDQEVVTVYKAAPSLWNSFFEHTHAAGVQALLLVTREMGVALVGTKNVKMTHLTIENSPMDGLFLSDTLQPEVHKTYCKHIIVHDCTFVACHRNGISVIDAAGVTISNNTFREIKGDPGAAVDVEPDHPFQHGKDIEIQANTVEDCFRGLSLSLQFSDLGSVNYQNDRILGNIISRTLFGWGVLVLGDQAGATVKGNSIKDPAGEGILVNGSSRTVVSKNEIIDPGSCAVPKGCDLASRPSGIRLEAGYYFGPVENNTISDNTIVAFQSSPKLSYGIDIAASAVHNAVQENTFIGFGQARGLAIHSPGAAKRNNTFVKNIVK